MNILQKFSKNTDDTGSAPDTKSQAKTKQKSASLHVLKQETGKPWPPLKGSEISSSKVTWFDRWLVNKIFEVLGFPAFEIRLWNGEEFSGSNRPPKTLLTLHDRGVLFKLCVNPEFYFGDLYSCGRIDFAGSLAGCVEEVNYGLSRVKTGKLRKLFIKFGYREFARVLINWR